MPVHICIGAVYGDEIRVLRVATNINSDTEDEKSCRAVAMTIETSA